MPPLQMTVEFVTGVALKTAEEVNLIVRLMFVNDMPYLHPGDLIGRLMMYVPGCRFNVSVSVLPQVGT